MNSIREIGNRKSVYSWRDDNCWVGYILTNKIHQLFQLHQLLSSSRCFSHFFPFLLKMWCTFPLQDEIFFFQSNVHFFSCSWKREKKKEETKNLPEWNHQRTLVFFAVTASSLPCLAVDRWKAPAMCSFSLFLLQVLFLCQGGHHPWHHTWNKQLNRWFIHLIG